MFSTEGKPIYKVIYKWIRGKHLVAGNPESLGRFADEFPKFPLSSNAHADFSYFKKKEGNNHGKLECKEIEGFQVPDSQCQTQTDPCKGSI